MVGNATVAVVSVTTTTDPDGNDTTIESVTQLEWAAVAPRSSTERTDFSAPAVITDAALYAPAAAAIDADDTVRVSNHSPAMDGDWQIAGMPGVWSSPFSEWRPGLEVALKRTG